MKRRILVDGWNVKDDDDDDIDDRMITRMMIMLRSCLKRCQTQSLSELGCIVLIRSNLTYFDLKVEIKPFFARDTPIRPSIL